MDQTCISMKGVSAGYGAVPVLRDVSIALGKHEVVGLIGPNGSGKSTTMKVIAGLLAPVSGELQYQGLSLAGTPPLERRLKGISYVPQERNVFPNLTVLENLETAFGVAGRRARNAGFQDRLDFLFTLFPRLAERRTQLAGSMSGGEQRMVAIAIGLVLPPTVLLLDEPTTGLAPHMVGQLMSTVESLCREQGISILIVEQNIISMVGIVDRLFILKDGVSQEYNDDPREIGHKNIWEYL